MGCPFGGQVVIQAKRYKHPIGVYAVCDLFVTLQTKEQRKEFG